MKITFAFDPWRSEKLAGIVHNPLAFSLWCLWKRSHIVPEGFEVRVLEIANRVGALGCIVDAKSVRRCFPALSHTFTEQDVAKFIPEWMPFVMGRDEIEVVFGDGKIEAPGEIRETAREIRLSDLNESIAGFNGRK